MRKCLSETFFVCSAIMHSDVGYPPELHFVHWSQRGETKLNIKVFTRVCTNSLILRIHLLCL